MKKFITALLGLTIVATAFSCKKTDTNPQAVATEVTTVQGENVADAQESLNESVISAKNEIIEAEKALEEARKSGNNTLVDAAQKKLDDLRATVKDVQSEAGENIRSTDGRLDHADRQLDNTVKAAEKKLDNIEAKAENVKDRMK